VCVCVGHEGSCSRTTEPIKMLFGGTRNLGLDGFFPPTGKGIFIGGRGLRTFAGIKSG